MKDKKNLAYTDAMLEELERVLVLPDIVPKSSLDIMLQNLEEHVPELVRAVRDAESDSWTRIQSGIRDVIVDELDSFSAPGHEGTTHLLFQMLVLDNALSYLSSCTAQRLPPDVAFALLHSAYQRGVVTLSRKPGESGIAGLLQGLMSGLEQLAEDPEVAESLKVLQDMVDDLQEGESDEEPRAH